MESMVDKWCTEPLALARIAESRGYTTPYRESAARGVHCIYERIIVKMDVPPASNSLPC